MAMFKLLSFTKSTHVIFVALVNIRGIIQRRKTIHKEENKEEKEGSYLRSKELLVELYKFH